MNYLLPLLLNLGQEDSVHFKEGLKCQVKFASRKRSLEAPQIFKHQKRTFFKLMNDIFCFFSLTRDCHDDAARFFRLIAKRGCNYIEPEDFYSFMQVSKKVFLIKTVFFLSKMFSILCRFLPDHFQVFMTRHWVFIFLDISNLSSLHSWGHNRIKSNFNRL